MAVEVVPSSEDWVNQYEMLAVALQHALRDIPGMSVEHVGSRSVPDLAAEPILDIDVIVEAAHVSIAVAALETVGYSHREISA